MAAKNAIGKIVPLPVPLTGFTAAYDGPPVDSKKYASARRNLMLQIRKRQIERAKKAEEERKKQGGGESGQQ